MKKEELINKYIQEDRLEQALFLLEHDNSFDSNGQKQLLLQECKRRLSDQYIYLIKEYLLVGNGKAALNIIDKYREGFGSSTQIEIWETEAMSLLNPYEKKLFSLKEKCNKISSIKPCLLFILVQIFWGITYPLTIENYDTLWLECLKSILIIAGAILLYLSFISIDNSVNLFLQDGRKSVNFLYMFIGTYIINQLYVSYFCFYPSFISDFIFEYFWPFIIAIICLQLLFIRRLYQYGNPEYKSFALLAIALIVFPFILYFKDRDIVDNLGWYPFFNIGGWCIYMLLFSLRVRAIVRNNKIDYYGNN